MRENGEDLGCQTSAWLDRLAAAKVAEGSGALGRHQRRNIVSGTILNGGAVALDTGLECSECGHDNYPAVYGRPFGA